MSVHNAANMGFTAFTSTSNHRIQPEFKLRRRNLQWVKSNSISIHHIRRPQKRSEKLKLYRKNHWKPATISTVKVIPIHQPDLNKKRKILWILALLVSGVICLFSLHSRVEYYFSNPIVTDVSIERISATTFPPVMLCRKKFANNFAIMLLNEIKRACLEMDQCRMVYNGNVTALNFLAFDYLNLTFTQIWNRFSIEASDIKMNFKCTDFQNKVNCRKRARLKVKVTTINTYFGRCFVFSPIDIVGADTVWEFNVKHYVYSPKIRSKNADTNFYIHSAAMSYNYDVFFGVRELLKYYNSDIRLSSKTFKFLNTTEKPCFDDKSVLECKKRCFEAKIKTTTNCSLPYMDMDLPACSNFVETRQAFLATSTTFMATTPSECYCFRMCNETTYLALMDVGLHKSNPNSTHFMFYFTHEMKEIISEKYLYTFPALLSDIASNLGFFLGISVLTAFELIIKVVTRMNDIYKHKIK